MIPADIAIQQFLQKKGYNKFTLKAVLFDMDGVLYDSLPNHASSWVTVMRNNGLNMTEADVYLNEGRIGYDTIGIIANREGKIIDPEDRKRIYQEKTILFNSYPPVSLMPFSRQLLQKIMTDKLLAFVVSGSGQPSLIERICQDFQGVFTPDNIVTSFNVNKGKPHPEPYLTALEKGRLNACEAIVVENAPIGIESACAAGLFVIAVNTGPLPDSVLLNSGANILFSSVETLFDEWEQLYDCLLQTEFRIS